MKTIALVCLALPLPACVVDWSLARGDVRAGEDAGELASDAEAASELASDAKLDTELDASELPGEPEAREAGEPDAEEITSDAAAPLEPEREAAIARAGAACAVPLELACTEHNVPQKLACVDGVWTFNGSCDGQARCDTRIGATQGTCQQIAAPCLARRPGDAFCQGLERKRCGPDLLDELPAPCGAHAHCDGGDASCVCDRGFGADDAGECLDIVDCPPEACSPGGRCADGLESFVCDCDVGYRLAADERSCVDIDDCQGVSCGPGGSCQDRVNGYECGCGSGFTPAADKRSCSDVTNDCPATDTCLPGICVDLPNAYTCQCAPPTTLFEPGDGQKYCVDPCSFPCACGGCG